MSAVLELERVSSGYGEATVLDQLSVALAPGEALSIVGRNGAGKSTLLATVVGHTTLFSGTIRFGGAEVTREPTHLRARRGIGYVPQEREIFPSLTVDENLMISARPGRWDRNAVQALFPNLKERSRNYGNQLSGGEQQMLAVGRALVTNPKLLMLDEPLEGLAPVIVEELFKALGAIRDAGGLAIVLVEQHASHALHFATRTVVMNRGTITYDGPSQALLRDAEHLNSLLGVSAE